MPLGTAALGGASVLPYRGHSVGEDGRTLGQRVTELMVGRNKALVARTAGLSRTQLLSIMDGSTKHPRIETLDALAEVLGTTRDALLYGKERNEQAATSLAALKGLLNQQRDMLIRQTESVIRAEATQLFWDSWDELESAVLDEVTAAPHLPASASVRRALDRVRASIEARLRGDQSDDGSSRQRSA